MATLIARLPSIRRNDGPSGDARTLGQHQRLHSPPPSPHVEEADLATLPPEPPVKKKKKKKRKGKEVDPSERGGVAAFGMEDDGADAGYGAPEEEAEAIADSYPPTTDEALETRRIEENLKHWDLLEKQRRKAARDSRAARTPSTLISDVAGYVTSFGAGAARPTSSSSSRQRPDGRGGSDLRLGGWTEASTQDSGEVELEDQRIPTVLQNGGTAPQRKMSSPVVSPTTPTAADTEKKRAVAGSRLSEGSIRTTDSGATVTSGPLDPFSDPRASAGELEEPSSPVRDPFVNPTPDKSKHDMDVPLLNPSPSVSPRTSRGMTLQIPPPPRRRRSKQLSSSSSQSPTRSKYPQRASTAPPPLVRPLDLPEARMPRMEPEPGTGHWRRAQEAKQRELELEEELERDRVHGRWWTDLFCGCREASRREEQDGRTNPFE